MPDQISPGHRALQRVTLGSGPLKRGSDRVEVLSRLLWAAVLLLAVPVALTVGTVVGADAGQQAREQAASRQQVAAVLVVDAPGEVSTGTGSLSVSVPATWRAPDGSRREGLVRALHGTPAGQPVSIWVDPEGTRTPPPLDSAGVVTSGLMAGVLTFLGLGILAAVGHLGVCRALWACRSRQWAEDWRSVEPQWTGRR